VRPLPPAVAVLLALACSAPHETARGDGLPERTVLLQRVDDVAVARLHVDGFENLSARDQALAYHLTRAAIAGRDIFLQQKCADGLALRDLLEEILTHSEGVDPATLAELRRYTTLFWVNNGPWNAITARKNLLRCTPEALRQAVHAAHANGGRFEGCPRGQNCVRHEAWPGHLVSELEPWFFDPAFEPMVTAKNPEGGLDIVQASSCTFYGEGVTLADLDAFTEQYELNSTVVRGEDGRLQELVWRAGLPEEGIPPGLYAAELNEVIACLTDALPFAPEPTRVALEKLIRFCRTGAVADREAYDIAWVADASSAVDTINGFVEVYVDPRGKKGSWEGAVFYEDPHKAELIKGLADNAQWFEDHMPYAPQFRKPQVRGISARSIDIVCETGDSGPVTPVGINLPNDQRIREQHGSKSVSLANVVTAGQALGNRGALAEFCWDAAEQARAERWGPLAGEMFTNMHEVIGHASGQQDAAHQGDPATWIGVDYSALEEGRADLVALYFMGDPKLKELGLLEDPQQAALASYEAYVRNGLLLQLRRIREGNQIEEDHMRNRALVANWILRNSTAIEPRVRGGKRFFVVSDAAAFRQAAGRLLAELQRIKSTGDRAAAAALFDAHGDTFEPVVRDEVLARYARLDVPSYTGFVMPRLSPVWGPDGALADVQLSYPASLEEQMLEWSGRRPPPVALPADPAALYHDVLRRLQESPEVELGFTLEASGANVSRKEGRLRVRAGNRVELDAAGPFNGLDSAVALRSDGLRLAGSASTRPLDEPADARLGDGLLAGLMARGLMHNLAMLSIGRPLDLSDGVAPGMTAGGFRALPDGALDGEPTRRIGFALSLGGQEVAQAELDVSALSGLPLRRTQVVHFPQGDMTVVERYGPAAQPALAR
jgi:dipeptidyl-peptidase-3